MRSPPHSETEKEAAEGASVVIKFDPRQEHDTRPIASGATQVNNRLGMPTGGLQAQGEILGLCPELTLDPSYLRWFATIGSLSEVTSIRDKAPKQLKRSHYTSRRPMSSATKAEADASTLVNTQRRQTPLR